MNQRQAAVRRATFPPYFLGRPSGVYLRRFGPSRRRTGAAETGGAEQGGRP
jgi:hypothetical protein